jgi:hypothetical protein
LIFAQESGWFRVAGCSPDRRFALRAKKTRSADALLLFLCRLSFSPNRLTSEPLKHHANTGFVFGHPHELRMLCSKHT